MFSIRLNTLRGLAVSFSFDSRVCCASCHRVATQQILLIYCKSSSYWIALVVSAQVWENENWMESVMIHARTVILALTFDYLKILIAGCQWKLQLLQSN